MAKFKKGDIVVINQYAASREKFYHDWIGLRCEIVAPESPARDHCQVKPLQDRPDAIQWNYRDQAWKRMGFAIQNEYLDLEIDLTNITPENYRID